MSTDERLSQILHHFFMNYRVESKKTRDEDLKTTITAIKEFMVEKDMVEVHEYWKKVYPSEDEMEKWIIEWMETKKWQWARNLAKFLARKMEEK